MPKVLHNWILVGSHAYDECAFVPRLHKNVYRRIVSLNDVCLLRPIGKYSAAQRTNTMGLRLDIERVSSTTFERIKETVT
jgi:hypothetical protein